MSKLAILYEPSHQVHTITIRNANENELKILTMILRNEASKLNSKIDVE